MEIPRKTAIASLQRYKVLRDALLFEDTTETPHHLNRFIEFIDNDAFIKSVFSPFVVLIMLTLMSG